MLCFGKSLKLLGHSLTHDPLMNQAFLSSEDLSHNSEEPFASCQVSYSCFLVGCKHWCRLRACRKRLLSQFLSCNSQISQLLGRLFQVPKDTPLRMLWIRWSHLLRIHSSSETSIIRSLMNTGWIAICHSTLKRLRIPSKLFEFFLE